MSIGATKRTLGHKLRWRGALVLALFGALWAAAGASGQATGPAVGVYALAIVVTVGLVWMAIHSASRPGPERSRRFPPRWERGVGIVNLAQLVGIVLAVVVLTRLDATALIPPVICLIVGVHFLPLARLYDQPQYTWTGGALCVAAVAGIAAWAGGADAGNTRAVVGFSAAVVLWATSLHLTVRR